MVLAFQLRLALTSLKVLDLTGCDKLRPELVVLPTPRKDFNIRIPASLKLTGYQQLNGGPSATSGSRVAQIGSTEDQPKPSLHRRAIATLGSIPQVLGDFISPANCSWWRVVIKINSKFFFCLYLLRVHGTAQNLMKKHLSVICTHFSNRHLKPELKSQTSKCDKFGIVNSKFAWRGTQVIVCPFVQPDA